MVKNRFKYGIGAAVFVLLLTSVYFGNSSAAVGAPDGKAIYGSKCVACHGAEGKGTPGVFPALAGNKDVTASDPHAIIVTVLRGQQAMPPFKGTLSNDEIAAVLTYIRAAWGNKASPVTVQQVGAVK